MNKTLITAAALAAAIVALPAVSNAAPVTARVVVATSVGYHDNGGRGGRWDDRGGNNGASFAIDRRINELDARIDAGRRSGSLSFREASRLSDRLNAIRWSKRGDDRSGRGLSGQEAASLNARLDDLSASVYGQRHDRNRW